MPITEMQENPPMQAGGGRSRWQNEAAFEARVATLGKEVFADIASQSAGVLDAEFYAGKMMDWAMKDEEFKVALFRFVDVFPALQDSAAIVRHAQEYFRPVAHRIPGLMKWGLDVEPNSLAARLAAPVISQQIKSMASRFIVGEDGRDALKTLRKIRKAGYAFTVDLLGEATVGEGESRQYLARYLELVETLGKEAPGWKESAPLVAGHRGEASPVNLSVKLSSLYSQFKAGSMDYAAGLFAERLAVVARQAKAVGAYLNVDMEDSAMTTVTLEAVKRLANSSEFADYPRLGLVLQAYLRRTNEDVEELLHWLRKRGTPMTVRLVKGAYWDTETILAKQRGWEIPVWQTKASSDATFEAVAVRLLENVELVTPAFASHNVRSLCFAVEAARELGVPPTHFEMQALYGMAEPIKEAFRKRGYLVREYAPVGELLPGMSYLVRRLLENTSNEGFLRQSFYEKEEVGRLLAKPELAPEDTGRAHLEAAAQGEFANAPFRDYSLAGAREALVRELATQKARLGTTESPGQIVRPMVEGKPVAGAGKRFPSVRPDCPTQQLAVVEPADIPQAEAAVQSLQRNWAAWRRRPMEERCQVLRRAAERMEQQRESLTATIILEAGKPWAEADADVAEAIDFCNYYAAEAMKMGRPRRMGEFAGEVNRYFYEPRGVALVISPWNFPLAIPCGMFAAALVMGNPVAFKPAEQTSWIAQRMFQIFLEAGMPGEAAAFLPGYGEEIGAYLAAHPLVATIAFTGSKAVGLALVAEGGQTRPGQSQVKRVIAEMGGKNAILVDESADLDEAVKGVVYSAFGFAGQKCSAASRVYVVASAYARFAERLQDAVQSLVTGPAEDPRSFLGPVIDETAYARIQKTVDAARQRMRVLAEGAPPVTASEMGIGGGEGGYFVRPIVFTEVPAGDPILTEEIFGPVLAVVPVKDFAAALAAAEESEYALTGAVFSRSPLAIQQAMEEFRVGNLYINRGSTGALVMRQAFGGFKMSGVGSKAGGPDYLLQFVVPRVVTENTLRRGFAPE